MISDNLIEKVSDWDSLPSDEKRKAVVFHRILMVDILILISVSAYLIATQGLNAVTLTFLTALIISLACFSFIQFGVFYHTILWAFTYGQSFNLFVMILLTGGLASIDAHIMIYWVPWGLLFFTRRAATILSVIMLVAVSLIDVLAPILSSGILWIEADQVQKAAWATTFTRIPLFWAMVSSLRGRFWESVSISRPKQIWLGLGSLILAVLWMYSIFHKPGSVWLSMSFLYPIVFLICLCFDKLFSLVLTFIVLLALLGYNLYVDLAWTPMVSLDQEHMFDHRLGFFISFLALMGLQQIYYQFVEKKSNK